MNDQESLAGGPRWLRTDKKGVDKVISSVRSYGTVEEIWITNCLCRSSSVESDGSNALGSSKISTSPNNSHSESLRRSASTFCVSDGGSLVRAKFPFPSLIQQTSFCGWLCENQIR